MCASSLTPPAAPVAASLFRPVETARTVDDLVAQIVDLIRSGRLVEGSTLPGERSLAARLQVSRATVRLAMSRLTDAGVVEVGVGRAGNARIRSMWIPEALLAQGPAPEGDAIFQLLEARRTLEPRVAQIAAARADGADFEGMQRAIDLLEAHREDRLRAGQAESLFHRVMWHAARNPPLEQMLVALFRRLDAVRDMMMRTSEDMSYAIECHKQTRMSLMRGDSTEIEDVMDGHLGHLEQMAEEVLGRRMRRDLPSFL